jgi:hypothetical protein
VLDRINNDGPYAPGNVKWSTYCQSNNNKRPSKPIGRSDVRGVYPVRNRWVAKVHSNDKCIHVGTFDEIEPAFIAYYLTKRALQREAT